MLPLQPTADDHFDDGIAVKVFSDEHDEVGCLYMIMLDVVATDWSWPKKSSLVVQALFVGPMKN